MRRLNARYIKRLCRGVLLLVCAISALVSCSKNDEPETPEPLTPYPGVTAERVVLVYAVNNSSLSSDFIDDRNEMEKALAAIPDSYRLMLYCIDNDSKADTYRVPVLLEAIRGNDGVRWRELNRYDKAVPSTDPDRIASVIRDALSVYPDASHDLFFWGHGTAWYPSGKSRKAPEPQSGSFPESYGYGGEYSETGKPLWTNVDELAAAVPDGRFDTIWFDCCYMSNIETIYEFLGKCDTFVGYATEVWQYGLPYDIVLPYVMRSNPDITGAAKRFFDYYNENGEPVTVAVSDMKGLERLASVSSDIFSLGDRRPATGELVRYSRSTQYAFYDFGEYMRLTARRNIPDVASPDYPEVAQSVARLISEFDAALRGVVVYHDASATDFNRRPWDTDAISGISTHWLDPAAESDPDNPANSFYRSLRWYNRVYCRE